MEGPGPASRPSTEESRCVPKPSPRPCSRALLRRARRPAGAAAGAARGPAAAGPPDAADHLPVRGELRRGRRRGPRCAGELRPRPSPGRLPGARGRRPADGDGVLAHRHPRRALRARAVPARGHRAGRDVERQRRPRGGCTCFSSTTSTPTRRGSIRVRQAARQFIERNLGANDLAAVLHTSGRSDGVAGLHQQPAAAHEGRGHVHGAQAALADAEQDRQLQPDPRRGPGADHRRRRAGRADAQRPDRCSRRSRTCRTGSPASTAGARPWCSSARASTTTSGTTRGPPARR